MKKYNPVNLFAATMSSLDVCRQELTSTHTLNDIAARMKSTSTI